MTKKYDLIFGLGAACSCSQALRAAHLQLLSFPFDWVVPRLDCASYDNDLLHRVSSICNDFPDWFRKEDFHFRKDPKTNGMLDYFNERLGLVFLHDFPCGIPFDESFPAVQAKYRRRIDRFIHLLRHSRKVLVVRIERPDLDHTPPLAHFQSAKAELTAKFPWVDFDFLAFRPLPGIAFEDRSVERPETWLTCIAFDYRSKKPGAQPIAPNFRELTDALQALATVREYRTRDEIRRHRQSELQKKLAETGCRNQFEYRIFKLKRKLARHLPFLFQAPTPHPAPSHK